MSGDPSIRRLRVGRSINQAGSRLSSSAQPSCGDRSYAGRRSCRNEPRENRHQIGAEMKALGFRFKQFGWAGRRFERVAKVRQSHEPDWMFDATVAMDVEGGPAGVRNPTVLFGEMAPKQKIMKRARKWDVDVSPEVDMTDFRLNEAIFPRCEPMGMYGNPRPR
jgi:hypothetical protein